MNKVQLPESYEIIRRFKAAYPDMVLADIAFFTGLKITRVYRLFNGSEMTEREAERFEAVLMWNEPVKPHLELIKGGE